MNLDLRIPMGLMFTMAGAILTAFGMGTRDNTALYAKSLGVDVNIWCGAVVLAFGVAMLTMGRRNQARLLRLEQGSTAPEGRLEKRPVEKRTVEKRRR